MSGNEWYKWETGGSTSMIYEKKKTLLQFLLMTVTGFSLLRLSLDWYSLFVPYGLYSLSGIRGEY